MSTVQTMTLVRRQVVQFGVLLSHVFLKLVKTRVAFPLPEAPRTAADLAMMETKFEMYGSFVTLKVSLSAEARPAGIPPADVTSANATNIVIFIGQCDLQSVIWPRALDGAVVRDGYVHRGYDQRFIHIEGAESVDRVGHQIWSHIVVATNAVGGPCDATANE